MSPRFYQGKSHLMKDSPPWRLKTFDIFAGHSFNSGHVYNGAVYRPNSRDSSANDSKLNNSANSGYGDQVSFSH